MADGRAQTVSDRGGDFHERTDSLADSTDNRLTTLGGWEQRWSDHAVQDIKFNPRLPIFADLHQLFTRVLPRQKAFRFLEIGCFPGSYMWYFNRYFGYQACGLEYVGACCARAKQNLQAAGVEAEIIHADLFDFEAPGKSELWDVVASFGFIEHFDDPSEAIKRHLELVKPGGYLVLVIPNHQGIYGRILKVIDEEKYRMHNRMSYLDIHSALSGFEQAEILEGGYYGRLGFWNCGLYHRVRRAGKVAYGFVRTPLWLIEQVGRLLPNSRTLSPNAAVIVRKSL